MNEKSTTDEHEMDTDGFEGGRLVPLEREAEIRMGEDSEGEPTRDHH